MNDPLKPGAPYSETSTHVELPEPIATSEAEVPRDIVVVTAPGAGGGIDVVISGPPPQPTMTPDEIRAIARGIRSDTAARAMPTMSEPEFAAWFQAFLTANSVLALDKKIGVQDRGRLAEAQADEALLAWKSKRRREGMAT